MTSPKLAAGRSVLGLPSVFLAMTLCLPQSGLAVVICDSDPYDAAAYFPLPDAGTWTYTNYLTNTVASGTTIVNTVATKKVVDDTGDATFYTNDTNGLRLHRAPSGFGDGDFFPPINLLGAEFCVGQQRTSSGTFSFYIVDIRTTLSYSSSSTVLGTERVTVPYGTFNTVKIYWTRRLKGTILGSTAVDETISATVWLVNGIGIVKQTDGPPAGRVHELLSTNVGGGCHAVNGTAGDDSLQGTADADCIDGKAGADNMSGLAGNDTYTVDNADDAVIEGAGEGIDTVKSSVTYALPIYVEKLVLTGTDNINGTGNGLANQIRGNSGHNTLNGGPGSDTLRGGAGQDNFLFKSALGSGNIDKITDFTPVDDTIRLENAIFTALSTTGTLASAAFKLGAAATAASHRIIYDPTTGAVRYDADGNGPAAAVRFATLTTKPVLTNADFYVQ